MNKYLKIVLKFGTCKCTLHQLGHIPMIQWGYLKHQLSYTNILLPIVSAESYLCKLLSVSYMRLANLLL